MNALVDWIVYGLFHMTPGNRLSEAVHFFLYDSMKILLMLAGIIYAISLIRSYFPVEKVKNLLSRRRAWVGHALASMLGVVTPFCSCSAVPVFIGFLEAGVPLGVTFSFLISSPMVNEVALVMLLGLFGWQIALLYIATGLTVAMLSGIVIGRLRLETEVEEYAYRIHLGDVAATQTLTIRDRHRYALQYTKDILKKIWLYVLLGISIGGFIHGYAPQDFLATYAGRDNWLAVPLAVLIGVPLYSNAAGTVPIVGALMDKGMLVGTALAFMMAVTALSLPEMIILRRVIKPKLIGIFAGIMFLAITGVGYLFNAILP